MVLLMVQLQLYLGYQSKKRFLTFTFWYTIISISVIFFWVKFPLIALLLFIIMSIIHFGLCDWSFLKVNQFKWVITLTHGINIIFGIIFFHTEESFQIFTFLSNEKFLFLEPYLFIIYLLFGILFLVYCYLSINFKKLRWGIFEMVSILFIVSQLDPLTGFALYFCFVHTTKHVYAILQNTNKYLENKKFVFTTTAIFTIVTWVGGCIAIIYLNNNYSFSESFIKTIFIGLAALTLPHMTLIDFFYRKKFN
jgi:Brp/Blh family beta-carotene 15,15'-monooxygenase